MSDNGPRAYSYIRMSTDMQLKGHSRQRQLEKSVAYAKAHDLDLVEEAQLEDIGVSAFKGANIKEGALGKFLEAVENKLIPNGSYLLVESLDRLSRQEILKSLSLFLRILEAGIILVTLQDERVYRGQPELSDLILSLTIMSRAHEESQLKSQRVAAAWANKRSQASISSRPLSKWCPAWLCLNSDRTHYEALPDRVAIIRSIYKDTVAGIGGFSITKRLNQRHASVMGQSNGWHPSYVAKILNSRAVIGEYQPCKIVNGKRQPVGDPIKNYFPRIIDDDLFYRAQQARRERRNNGSGRKGKYVTNLFSGLATCLYCHSPMMVADKGPLPKGGKFLVCEGARRGRGCVTTGWRYDQFESSFLAFVEKIELPRLVREDDSEKKVLDDAIQALEGQKMTLREEMEGAYGLIKINPELQFVADKLSPLQQQVQEIEQQLIARKIEREGLESIENAFYESREEIRALVERLQSQTSGRIDLYKLRSQVAARIKALVEKLKVATAGTGPIMERLLKYYESIKMDDETREILVGGAKNSENRRFFRVTFKDGSQQGIWPDKDDPLTLYGWHESEPLN